jgi:hypothetical protein
MVGVTANLDGTTMPALPMLAVENFAAVPDFALDEICAGAVELARAAAVDLGRDAVGEHLGVRPETEHAVTHGFAATQLGYRGWYWAVTVGRAPGLDPTVAEVVLLPGESAVLAPAWVPWSERVERGDLTPGDLLPAGPDDPRLVPSYLDTDDEQVAEVAYELGVGRVRVLSRLGRYDATERWYDGDGGPDTPMAKQAPAHCGSCGFMVQLDGSLRAAFGVCANEISDSDGRVVSYEHGCGAHSEVVLEIAEADLGSVFDDESIEVVSSELASAEPTGDVVEQDEIDAEVAVIEPVDGDDAGDGGQAEDEPAAFEIPAADLADLDPEAPITGGVEQAPPSDTGQDLIG